MRRGALILAAALCLPAAACSNDGVELTTFSGTGEVVAVEPDAQPADGSDDNISGAVIVEAQSITGLDDCPAADDGFRIFLDDDSDLTPSDAEDDLESLRGKTVRVSGRVSKDGDVCTPVADSVTARDAGDDAESGGVTGTGAGADGTGTGDGDGAGAGTGDGTGTGTGAGATASPRDDQGGIGSPKPESEKDD